MSEYSPDGIMVSVRLRPNVSFSAIRLALIDDIGKENKIPNGTLIPGYVESTSSKLLSSVRKPSLAIACYNAADQIILSGTPMLVTLAIKRLTELKLFVENSSKKLSVSGAFHSPLMNKASDKFGKALDQMQFLPITGYRSNVDSYFSSSILTEVITESHANLSAERSTGFTSNEGLFTVANNLPSLLDTNRRCACGKIL